MLKILRKLARIFVCVACTKMKPQMNTDPCSSVVSSLLWLRLGCAVEFVAAFFCG